MFPPYSMSSVENESENGSSSRSCTSSPDVDLDVDEDTQNIQCMWSHCGAWCPDSKTLTVHITEDHMKREDDGAYYCQWSTCLRKGKGFNARYKMIVHVRTHTRDKPLQCKFCMKKYSRNENLKIHIRSHTGEKPYVCKECGKAFSNSSDKFKHVRTHYEKKPYGCKVAGCTKRYTDPSSLRKHVKTYKHESRLSESSVQTSPSSSPQSTSSLHIPVGCEPMDQGLEKESPLSFPSYYEHQTISRPVPQYMFVPLWNLWIPQPAVWPETPLDLATTPLDLSCRVAAASSEQETRLTGNSSPS